MLFFFTFITMVGGNPDNDAYGFRYWKNPGAFAENSAKSSTGSLARFEGFLSALWSASFTVVRTLLALVWGDLPLHLILPMQTSH
jgi:yeast amino acid transporter